MDFVVRELSKNPELRLSLSGVKSVSWKYFGYLIDPRLFFTFEDGSVFKSAELCDDTSPALLEQFYKKWIEHGININRVDVYSIVSADWKYGKNVHDKRLVFHCEDGEVFTSGPFDASVNVPLLAQSFSDKFWIEGEKSA